LNYESTLTKYNIINTRFHRGGVLSDYFVFALSVVISMMLHIYIRSLPPTIYIIGSDKVDK